MATIEFDRVSFAYAGAAPILQACSFRLAPGMSALVGENGAGKSTLLRLMSGALSPESGQIRRLPRDLRISHCDEQLDLESACVRSFAADGGVHAHRVRVQLDLLPYAGKGWSSLSPGLRRRFQLAAAIHADPDVLLLDEPSNHIDLTTRDALIRALLQYRGTTLLVSHDRALIDVLAARTLVLSRSTLRSYEGGYTAARRAIALEQESLRHERSERERTAKHEQQRLDEARRQQAAADRARSMRHSMKDMHDHDARSFGRKIVAGWAEARHGRTVTVQRRTAEQATAHARALHIEKPLGRRLFASFVPCPRPHVVELHAELLGYPGNPVLHDVHLVLARDARVKLEGANGAGKTTLLLALQRGCPQPERVLYVPQELTPSATKQRLAELHQLDRAQKGQVLDVVAALGVDPARLLRTSSPSAGEARKLWLALGLGRGVHCLFLDEPTNDLDLPSIERLETALRDYPGALLVVTHDAHFAANTLRQHWRVENGRVLQ